MENLVEIIHGIYQDSLKLMRISGEVRELPGISQAFAFMGTKINKETRVPVELQNDDVRAAGADDLILLIECDSLESGKAAMGAFKTKMAGGDEETKGEVTAYIPKTLDEACTGDSAANIAVISVPGVYAAAQAMRALQLGLHVHLFSDNVSVAEEIELKDLAVSKGLLMMGPDCGTAIINGVPLCFANQIRRGSIGVVGASGTGIQEFTCLVDALGEGISHALGTGGRDLTEEVDARMSVPAIQMLANDPDTKLIAVISKPPAPSAAKRVLEAIKASGKPAVLVFMGKKEEIEDDNIGCAATLEQGAALAVAMLRGQKTAPETAFPREPMSQTLADAIKALGPGQKYIRALYTGGTLASEALWLLLQKGLAVNSNVHVAGAGVLPDPRNSAGNTVVDLGDDIFTRGALHPMIDPSCRSTRIKQELADPETAVVLLDVVLGAGSHEDPAGAVACAIEETTSPGAQPVVIASVTGTQVDMQRLDQQTEKLRHAGVFVFPSNQYAVEMAAESMKLIEERGGWK